MGLSKWAGWPIFPDITIPLPRGERAAVRGLACNVTLYPPHAALRADPSPKGRGESGAAMARNPETSDWSSREAPSLAEFEAIADQAYAKLPTRFRDLCNDVVIRVEDFPTDEVLDGLGIESPFDLLGLYHGVDLARRSIMDVTTMPEMVFLYRRPILDHWAEHDETLGRIVTHVLIHEIGHHFGLSDADMERIEAEASA